MRVRRRETRLAWRAQITAPRLKARTQEAELGRGRTPRTQINTSS
jgi:hypothetical protein